jgi:hypothetical protein
VPDLLVLGVKLTILDSEGDLTCAMVEFFCAIVGTKRSWLRNPSKVSWLDSGWEVQNEDWSRILVRVRARWKAFGD